MLIRPFDPAMAPEVARCYNDLIAPVPECSPVPADRFANFASPAHRLLRDEALVVAQLASGGIAGFVHVGVSLPPDSDEDPPGGNGAIRALAYRPGERRVGQALLDWAENWALTQRLPALIAWSESYRYPFYHFPCAHLSEYIGHVRALFMMAGYSEFASEQLLTCRDFAPPEPVRPDIDFDLESEWTDGILGPRLEVRAMQGGDRIGTCLIDRGKASPAPDAQDWCFCLWLNIAQPFQGQRLGHFLLATSLAEMHRGGCRHAAISTAWSNYRASLMYTNLGYRHADRTCCFLKKLDASG